MRKIRGNRIAMVFREPMTSLNPLHTVGKQINEVLKSTGPARQGGQCPHAGIARAGGHTGTAQAHPPTRTNCPAASASA